MIINPKKLAEFVKVVMHGSREEALRALTFPTSGLNLKLEGGVTIGLGIDTVMTKRVNGFPFMEITALPYVAPEDLPMATGIYLHYECLPLCEIVRTPKDAWICQRKSDSWVYHYKLTMDSVAWLDKFKIELRHVAYKVKQ